MRYGTVAAIIILCVFAKASADEPAEVMDPVFWIERAEATANSSSAMSQALLMEASTLAGDAEKRQAAESKLNACFEAAAADFPARAKKKWREMNQQERLEADWSNDPEQYAGSVQSNWTFAALAPLSLRDQAETLKLVDRRDAWVRQAAASAGDVAFADLHIGYDVTAAWAAEKGMYEFVQALADREPTPLHRLRTLERAGKVIAERGDANVAKPMLAEALRLGVEHVTQERAAVAGQENSAAQLRRENAEYDLFSVADTAGSLGFDDLVLNVAEDRLLSLTERDRERLRKAADQPDRQLPAVHPRAAALAKEVAILETEGVDAILAKLDGGDVGAVDLPDFAYEVARTAKQKNKPELMKALHSVIEAADSAYHFRANLETACGLLDGHA